MLYSQVVLRERYKNFPETNFAAELRAYIPRRSDEIPRSFLPAVLVIPGGGYAKVSDREAEPVALRFLAKGFVPFVLQYSVAPSRYPTQLLEAAAALAHIRGMAAEYGLDPVKIATCGFSAGGHLAASLGNHWADPLVEKTLGLSKGAARPNAQILCYPVITAGEFAHRGSFENLLGEFAAGDKQDACSLEKTANPDAPPTFLWHTCDDAAVPVQNSLLYANALLAEGVDVELHLYPHGVHGMSLADASTARESGHIDGHVATWFDLATGWLGKVYSA